MDSVFLHEIRHLAILDDTVFEQFLEEAEDHVTILGAKKSQKDKIQIAHPSGESRRERIKDRKEAFRLAHGGTRWVGRKRLLDVDGAPIWRTVYSDSPTGQVYELPADYSVICPRLCTKLIAKSVDGRYGGGELICYEDGQARWRYRPTEEVQWPFWDVGVRTRA